MNGVPFICWVVAIVFMFFFPPKFIGDYNIKISLFLIVCMFYHFLLLSIPQIFTSSKDKLYIALAVTVASFPIVTIFTLSRFSSWCCVQEADFERLCSLATRTALLLETNSIPYWVCWGSLLGAYRESALPFQAIPWEHDFDLCVREADWGRMVSVLRSSEDVRFNELGKVVYDTDFRTTMARAYVDLYRYSTSDDGEWLETTEGSHEIKRTKVSTILPHKTINVCNRHFSGPNDPKQAIADIYGEHFMERRWPPGLTGFTCKLYADCKLPSMPI